MANSDFFHDDNSLSRLFRQMQDQQNRWREDMERMQDIAAQASKWLAENEARTKKVMEAATALRQQIPVTIGLSDRTIQQFQEEQNRRREDMKHVEDMKRMQEADAQWSKWLAEDQALMKDAVEAATALRQQVQGAIGLPDRAIQQFQEEQNRLREDMKRMQEADAQRSKWLADQAFVKDAVEAATALRHQIPVTIGLTDRVIQQFREEQDRWRESLNLTSLLDTGGIVGRYRQELQSLSRFVNEIPGALASQLPQSRDSLEISPDGTISLGSISVSAAEFEENLEEFFSHAIDADFFDKFWERLDSYKAPIKAWFIKHFLPTLLSAIILYWAGIIYTEAKLSLEYYIAKNKPNSSQDVKQAIKNFPPDLSILDHLDYRVVALTKGRLMLREKPTTESAIINRLDRGKCVRVIKSYNNWSFVEVSLDCKFTN